jgi:hypothetical protein
MIKIGARWPWLTPVILGSWFKASPGKQFVRPYLEKAHHKKGLVQWLKV